MEIIAVAGLAQNFAAVRSLITSGIQKGHMKMHLLNILNQNQASADQKEKGREEFLWHKIIDFQEEYYLGAWSKFREPSPLFDRRLRHFRFRHKPLVVLRYGLGLFPKQ